MCGQAVKVLTTERLDRDGVDAGTFCDLRQAASAVLDAVGLSYAGC
jgi:hypothetical protein